MVGDVGIGANTADADVSCGVELCNRLTYSLLLSLTGGRWGILKFALNGVLLGDFDKKDGSLWDCEMEIGVIS